MPGSGQLVASGTAREQPSSELGLERGEPATDCRLCHAEGPRRRRQRVMTRDREEEPEVVPGKHLPIMHECMPTMRL